MEYMGFESPDPGKFYKMAKSKKATVKDAPEFVLREVEHEKFEKPTLLENGEVYENLQEYRISTKGNIIPAGFTLKQCSDGWFQVFNENNEKHFFRISRNLLAILPLINRIN